jgi:hypothetical protein
MMVVMTMMMDDHHIRGLRDGGQESDGGEEKSGRNKFLQH